MMTEHNSDAIVFDALHELLRRAKQAKRLGQASLKFDVNEQGCVRGKPRISLETTEEPQPHG